MQTRTDSKILEARGDIAEQNNRRKAIVALTCLIATLKSVKNPLPKVFGESDDSKILKRFKALRSRQIRLFGRTYKITQRPKPKLLHYGADEQNRPSVRWSDGKTTYSFPVTWSDAREERIPESLVSPALWERMPISENVFAYDAETDSVMLLYVAKPDTDIGGVCYVRPQPSRAIRSSFEINTFDRVGFLREALRQLRQNEAPKLREEFDAVIRELSDADFLQSLRGFRRPLQYKRFRVRKTPKKVWTWQPNRRKVYLDKIENMRNGSFASDSGKVYTFEPYEIHIRADGCPIVLRSLDALSIPFEMIPKLDETGEPMFRDNGTMKMMPNRCACRHYRKLYGYIFTQWERLVKCGISQSERDEFREECEQTAAMMELENRKEGVRPQFDTFKAACFSCFNQFIRRHQLRDITTADDATGFIGKRNVAPSKLGKLAENLNNREKAIGYLVGNGFSLEDLIRDKTLTKWEAVATAKRFRECGIL